jgi:hypothetical protein
VTVTEPKLELPPFVPLSAVYPVALSESRLPLQLIKAAEPPAPTLIATAAAGVKDSVVKLTPPPPPPAPKLIEQTPRLPPPPPATTKTSADVTPVGTVQLQVDVFVKDKIV